MDKKTATAQIRSMARPRTFVVVERKLNGIISGSVYYPHAADSPAAQKYGPDEEIVTAYLGAGNDWTPVVDATRVAIAGLVGRGR